MHTKYIFADGDIERFWSKVDRSGGPSACWLWLAPIQHHYGYGSMWLKSARCSIPAHRLAWFLQFGDIPEGMLVCHDCPDGDNPQCCNPSHMFLGTYRDNAEDRERKGRHSHEATWAGVGEDNPKAKMTEVLVIEARRRYAAGGVSQSQLAREFGISTPMMNHIILQKHWTHLPSVDDLREAA